MAERWRWRALESHEAEMKGAHDQHHSEMDILRRQAGDGTHKSRIEASDNRFGMPPQRAFQSRVWLAHAAAHHAGAGGASLGRVSGLFKRRVDEGGQNIFDRWRLRPLLAGVEGCESGAVDRFYPAFKNGHNQILEGAEVVVDGAQVGAGCADDVAHGDRSHAMRGKQAFGSVQELRACVGCLSAGWSGSLHKSNIRMNEMIVNGEFLMLSTQCDLSNFHNRQIEKFYQAQIHMPPTAEDSAAI